MASSFKSLADFHQREFLAVREIKQRYEGRPLTQDKNLTAASKPESGAKQAGETKEPETVLIDKTTEAEAEQAEELPSQGLPAEVTERRRDIWKQVMQKSQYITNEQREQLARLLNYAATMRKEGYLVAISDCLENVTNQKSAQAFLKKCDEIYQSLQRIKELGETIEKERYFSGIDLIDYFETSDPGKKASIDWSSLKEKLGTPLHAPRKARLRPEAKRVGLGESALPVVLEKLQEITQVAPPELSALVEAYNYNPNRTTAYALEQVLKEKLGADNVVALDWQKEKEGRLTIGIKDHQAFLINPETGEKISTEYPAIHIAPHLGLVRVGGWREGCGYIDLSGKEIFPLEPGYLPEYHNGSELVSNGYKVINIASQRTLAEVEGGDSIHVFGNLYRTEVLLEQHGREKIFEYKLCDAQGNLLNFGDPKDIKVITVRVDPVPYTSPTGRSETTHIITNVAVKIEGKYGLVDSLTGKMALPPKYKEISQFYGGFKFAGSRKKPVFNREGEVIGYDEMAAKVPLQFIMTEDEQGNFRLLDQEYNDLLGQTYKSQQELTEAYDRKYPNNTRKYWFLG